MSEGLWKTLWPRTAEARSFWFLHMRNFIDCFSTDKCSDKCKWMESHPELCNTLCQSFLRMKIFASIASLTGNVATIFTTVNYEVQTHEIRLVSTVIRAILDGENHFQSRKRSFVIILALYDNRAFSAFLHDGIVPHDQYHSGVWELRITADATILTYHFMVKYKNTTFLNVFTPSHTRQLARYESYMITRFKWRLYKKQTVQLGSQVYLRLFWSVWQPPWPRKLNLFFWGLK